MRILSFLCAGLMLCAAGVANAELIVTGVFDGPLSGGLPKVVELYAAEDIADLSTYGVGAANNGGGTDGVELIFSGSASAGDFLYVADTGSTFTPSVFSDYFGVTPTLLFDGNFANGGAAAINGNDAVEVFFDATGAFSGGESVVDVFGEVAGAFASYADGWAYRNNGTGPDDSTYVAANWAFSGTDINDGKTTNIDPAAFPIGSYTAIPEPGTAALALMTLAAAGAASMRKHLG